MNTTVRLGGGVAAVLLPRITALNKVGILAALLGSLLVVPFTQPAHALVYSVDDGTADASIGVFGGITFANQFVVVPGGETITSISIVWGLPGIIGVPNGTAMTAKLWSDPNGDGNPSDAVVLSSIAGITSSFGTDTFVAYDIPDITLLDGQSFFVGATINSNASTVGLDTDNPISNHGWFATGGDLTNSPENLSIANNFHVDLMVRANAVAAALPEPGALALFGVVLGAFGVTARRRNRSWH